MVSKMDWQKFTYDYRLDLTASALLRQVITIEAYKEAALNLVIPPTWREQLDKLNRVRAVYGTTALEGNPLSEAEVSKQMDVLDQRGNEALRAPKLSREQIQILNSSVAQASVKARFRVGSAPIQVPD